MYTPEEVDAINLQMLEQAVPNRPEMVSFIWQLGKAYEKYKIFSRLVFEMSEKEKILFFAKVFYTKNGKHFHAIFEARGSNFMLFLANLDNNNRFEFLDFLFDKAIPNSELELFLSQLFEAFNKYLNFSRLVSEMTFEKSVAFFAKIFQQEKNNQDFYWKFVEKGGSFMMFMQSLDYKNQALFLNYLNTLK